ncbi:hypothetical protein [Kutzneria sp. NPDC052558]|uniref:hypothetical protein n=1 Tax=Kutzneria sp. NPDC052558 TaxID=3364121 RepID=UPI0037CC8DC0
MSGSFRPPVVYTLAAMEAALANDRRFMALHKCFLLDECQLIVPSVVHDELRRRRAEPLVVMRACKVDQYEDSPVVRDYMVDFALIGKANSQLNAVTAATAVAYRAVVVTSEVNALELMWAVPDPDRPMSIITI